MRMEFGQNNTSLEYFSHTFKAIMEFRLWGMWSKTCSDVSSNQRLGKWSLCSEMENGIAS